MNLDDFQAIDRRARELRARQKERLFKLACDAIRRMFAPDRPAASRHDPVVERFIGLASFQDRLKNSRPPRIAFIRSTNRSKCSGTSTKLRRSLLTMSSGLSE